MGAPILEAVDVVKDYKTRAVTTRALAGLSLRVEAGEFSAIAGPSGCGKTTLLNLLGTLDTATRGHVMVGGERVDAMSEAARAQLRLRKMVSADLLLSREVDLRTRRTVVDVPARERKSTNPDRGASRSPSRPPISIGTPTRSRPRVADSSRPPAA